MNPERMELTTVLPLILGPHDDVPLRNVAMLAAWHHRNEPISQDIRNRLTRYLEATYRSSPNREAHAVAGLLLGNLGVNVDQINAELAQDSQTPLVPGRQWFTNQVGQTMVLLAPRRDRSENDEHSDELDYTFAISATEVTYELFRQFAPEHSQQDTLRVSQNEIPATNLVVVEIAGFCNWLSRRDRIPPEQWCYPPASELSVANCGPVPDYLDKSGYRLPTEREWEIACRAGSSAIRFFGDDATLTPFYGWDRTHAYQKLQRVAQLLPNPFGLFDVYGNAEEICMTQPQNQTQPGLYHSRGQSCLVTETMMRSDSRQRFDHRSPSQYTGFRVVKAMR